MQQKDGSLVFYKLRSTLDLEAEEEWIKGRSPIDNILDW